MTTWLRARTVALFVAGILALGLTAAPAWAQPEPEPEAPSSEEAASGDDDDLDEAEDGTSSDPESEDDDAEAEETEEAAEDELTAPDPGAVEPSAESGAAETSTTSGSTASAPEDVAVQQAEAARAFYREGNYVAALGAFKIAFELAPTAALAYNVARSHERLSQWAEAIEWYRRYVDLETDPRERAEALDKIALLEQRAGGTSDTDQYEARMLSGRRAYSRGDFEGAIEDFRAAFDVRAEPGALYNIAKSFEKMARYEDALDYYRQYLELAPNAPDKADVESIMERLERDIRLRFQELAVASDPPGADVYLDDRNEGIIGQTNLRTKLRPGPHTLFIDLNGYETVRRDFTMPDDKPLALEFDLEQLKNVGYVTIDVVQPGARIFVDGAIVGLSPFTQKKALESGEHQLQVELPGYDRFARAFEIGRDATVQLDVDLKKYDPPVSDGTLSDWGRNLILFGVIGGGLGFAGPIVYQEFVLGRSYFSSLGPDNGGGRPFYDGSPQSLTQNEEFETLETVQLASAIAGGTLIVGGFIFYMYKWIRTTPPPPVTASTSPEAGPWVEITGLGLAPAPGGATLGLSGRF